MLVLSPVPSDPDEDLGVWFAKSEGKFSQLRCELEEVHSKRVQRLQEMPARAKEILWWPFTQHSLVPTSAVTVIDSRCGENFSIHKVSSGFALKRPLFIIRREVCIRWYRLFQTPTAFCLEVESQCQNFSNIRI